MAATKKKFEVRLESTTDAQFRILRGRFKNAAEARSFADAREQEYVSFELAPDALAEIERDHRLADADEIDPRTGDLYKTGTIVGPNANSRTLLHFHYLTVPYKAVDVKEV